MDWKALVRAFALGLGGAAAGVGVAFVAGHLLQSYVGEENAPLVWLVGGVGGFVLGFSQASWRKRRRRRRRRRPQVVLPPMKPAPGGGERSVLPTDAAPQPAAEGDLRELFRQATDAAPDELTNVCVCDVRLDHDGEPLSVRLTQGGQEREIFLVHDHHRDVVAEALDAALQREPGNRRARLFV